METPFLGKMKAVAVVGTGISGMSCAARIHPHVRLTVFEKESEPGGHTHTIDYPEEGRTIPVDAGFMVYNEITYPRLTRLFRELDVPTKPTDMSFGVQIQPEGIEFCGSGLNGLLARRTNALRPDFWRMMKDILAFNKRANSLVDDNAIEGLSLAEFVEQNGFSKAFLRFYLIPMTSAIWSTPPDKMLDFPASSLIRFMYNHGLLGVRTQHPWRTVEGGSRTYRDRLIAPFRAAIHTKASVQAVWQEAGKVFIRLDDGSSRMFDAVILATHADDSFRLLSQPTPLQERLLPRFRYAENSIKMHGDSSVMPRKRAAWASWNYRMDPGKDGESFASTHYWMNRLQGVSDTQDLFVSVNDPELVDPDKIFKAFSFSHPTYDRASVEAQSELPELNREGRIFFCGAYFRYGFHEDGLMSGHNAATTLLQRLSPDAELPL